MDDICKLQRKDTPHHFKGKRIVDTEEDKERLHEILSSIEKRKSADSVDETDRANLIAANVSNGFCLID